MATLQPFFASGTQTGSKEIIETQIVFWVNIGTGVFSVTVRWTSCREA